MKFRHLSTKIIIRRLSVFTLICISFGFLLNVYGDNEEMIKAFKPYYAKSYFYAAQYSFNNSPAKVEAQNTKASASYIPVLVYHGILEKQDKVSTNLEQFKDEMFALKNEGYQTVHIDDFNNYIQGKKQLPDKSFLLTFDDGRKDSYYPVDPILKELNYSAVMFVITGTLEKTNGFHLTKNEFKKMRDSGRWDLEAHTYQGHGLIQIDEKGTKGHFYSNKMWLKDKKRLETEEEFQLRINGDLKAAKSDMQKYFGIKAYAFAFPFNDYARESLNFSGSQEIFNKDAKDIYTLLFYQSEPPKGSAANQFGSKSQLISRINVETFWSTKDLMKVVKIKPQ